MSLLLFFMMKNWLALQLAKPHQSQLCIEPANYSPWFSSPQSLDWDWSAPCPTPSPPGSPCPALCHTPQTRGQSCHWRRWPGAGQWDTGWHRSPATLPQLSSYCLHTVNCLLTLTIDWCYCWGEIITGHSVSTFSHIITRTSLYLRHTHIGSLIKTIIVKSKPFRKEYNIILGTLAKYMIVILDF